MDKFLIVLLGPTGVGKTDISIELAELFNLEIISADSRQFFREMSIGTAVPSEDNLIKIKHHFIKFLSVRDYYSSSMFEQDVLTLLTKLYINNTAVLMTGGSGMYIDAVCKGIDDIPDIEPAIREKYNLKYNEEGIEGLRAALKLLDPLHYTQVDLRNHKRIMRALEICDSTGLPYSSFLKGARRVRNFNIIKIGLERDRKDLYARIDERVDAMVKNGLEEEARSVYMYRDLNALKSVGYREFFDYFDGKISRDQAIYLIKRNSRRYAKRQITWWAKDKDIRWFHPEQVREITEYINFSITPRPPQEGG